jgi:hypothetical protein
MRKRPGGRVLSSLEMAGWVDWNPHPYGWGWSGGMSGEADQGDGQVGRYQIVSMPEARIRRSALTSGRPRARAVAEITRSGRSGTMLRGILDIA